jgi:hypothetical protein
VSRVSRMDANEESDVNEQAQDHHAREHEGPDGKVLGAVEPDSLESVRGALVAAGFPADEIDVVTTADLEAMEGPFEHDGLRGFVERFVLSLGEDLNALDELRRWGKEDHTLIGVPVMNDEEMYRAAGVLREHGAHEITHFGRWTITTL